MRNAILNLEPAAAPARSRDEFSDRRDLLVRTKVLSIVLGVLVVAFVAALWFNYPMLRDQKVAIAELLERMGSTEGQIGKLSASLPALADRMDAMQTSMKSNLQTVKSQMSRSLQAIQKRVSGLESNQRESSERVNQLQEQVNQLQKELAAMKEKPAEAAVETNEAPKP